MILNKYIRLPVILVASILLSAQFHIIYGRYVILHDQFDREVDIGNVDLNEKTVGELKQLISERMGIDLASIRLLSDRVPMLKDEKPISYYVEIDEEPIIKLRNDLTRSGVIQIALEKKILEIVITKDKTLGFLKNEVLGESEKDFYRVFYEGTELVDESKTLADYQLHSGAYLTMTTSDDTFPVIIVPLEGNNLLIDATVEYTVSDLRVLIADAGVDMENVLLFSHNYRRLKDDTKLYSHSRTFLYGMVVKLVKVMDQSGAIVEMFYRKSQYTQHFSVYVTPNNTVGDMKKYAFQVDKSIPANQMDLVFEGELLEDDARKLADFGLYLNARVQVNRKIGPSKHKEDEKISLETTKETIKPETSNSAAQTRQHQDAKLLDHNKELDSESSPSNDQKPRKECWICYEKMMNDETKVVTDCGHMFHRKCLIDWKDNGKHDEPICPTCRCKLTDRCFEPV